MSISMECYYSSLVVARLVSQAALLFSLFLRWLLWDSLWPMTTMAATPPSADGERAAEASARRRSAAAQAVRDVLRISTYAELVGEDESAAVAATTCAVCLGKVHGRDNVWELGNCRHLFHKGCLDQWLDHDARLTCPLCRAPLLNARAPPLACASPSSPAASSELSWAVERLLYLFGDDLLFAPSS